jgi:dihydroflavonol-4-reductase
MIIVTGGSGFLGKFVLKRLVEKGYETINLINKTQSKIEGVKELKLDDISVDYLKKIITGADTIIHMAAALGWTKEDYDYYYRINTLFPENMIKAAVSLKIRKFIYISSAGIYGKGIKEEVIKEDYPPQPEDFYEKTKYEGEKAVLKYKDKIRVNIIRPGWIYGPEDKRTLKLFKMINKGYFFIAGKGDGKQTPVYVEDIADGIILLMESDKTDSGDIFNMASDEIITTEEMVKTIANTLNKKILPFKIPLSPLKFMAKTLDIISKPFGITLPLTSSSLAFFERSKPLSIEKAKKIFGYSPKIKFIEGIKQTIDRYKKQKLL